MIIPKLYRKTGAHYLKVPLSKRSQSEVKVKLKKSLSEDMYALCHHFTLNRSLSTV